MIITTTGTLAVDYSKSLEQMIALGKYVRRSDSITSKKFRVRGRRKEEVESSIFDFKHFAPSIEETLEMQAAGWQYARIEHLLSFRMTNPNYLYHISRRTTLVAFGSIAKFDWGFGTVYINTTGSGDYILELLGCVNRSVKASNYSYLAIRPL